MDKRIEQLMISWNRDAGDRGDPVASLCRALYSRLDCCPCLTGPKECVQCINDKNIIELAWNATQ